MRRTAPRDPQCSPCQCLGEIFVLDNIRQCHPELVLQEALNVRRQKGVHATKSFLLQPQRPTDACPAHALKMSSAAGLHCSRKVI